ncbi:MAG: hypothetical protein ACOY4T_07320, partial [Pseudomonadota bacterium]
TGPAASRRMSGAPAGPAGEGDDLAADGAQDMRRCHTAIIGRQGAAIIPIRRNGRARKADAPAAIARNETLRATRHYGRAIRKPRTGDRARQTAEIQIRAAPMNRFPALGTAGAVRLVGHRRGKGRPRLRREFCSNAGPLV